MASYYTSNPGRFNDQWYWGNGTNGTSFSTSAQTYYSTQSATLSNTNNTWYTPSYYTTNFVTYAGAVEQPTRLNSRIRITEAPWVDGFQNQVWRAWSEDIYQNRLLNPTAEEITAHRERVAADAERIRQQDERRITARARARTLLDSCLGDVEVKRLSDSGCIHVVGSAGNHYCIKARGQAGNVHWFNPNLKDGCRRPLGSFCAHPSGVPDADAWLTQKLAIETDEALFLRIANVQAGRAPSMALAP